MEKMILTIGFATAALVASIGSFMYFDDPAALFERVEASATDVATDPEDGTVPSTDLSNSSDSTVPGDPAGDDSAQTSPQPQPDSVVPSTGGGYDSAFAVSYEQYQAMSAEEQQAWFESFETVEAFFDWYNAAKAEYDEHNNAIVIGSDGVIDMSQIAG